MTTGPARRVVSRLARCTTSRLAPRLAVGLSPEQPWRDGRFWPDAASLLLEYALACPSSQMLIPGLTSGQNRSVSVVQYDRKLL